MIISCRGLEMRTSGPRSRAVRCLAALAVSTAAAACSRDAPPPRPEQVTPLTEAERTSVEARGAEAAALLQSTLVPRLLGTLEDDGPAAAARMCAIEATTLTESVARLAGLEVKRTSSRIRNPANAPDDLEQEALRHFVSQLDEDGSLPSSWVQVVSDEEARFYRPLIMGEGCLACHGEASALAPGVAELLAERYPDDRATGYRSGDFRGLIRVSVPRAGDRTSEGS